MEDLIIVLGLLSIGYFAGRYNEQCHFKNIKKREWQTLHLSVVTYGAK